MISGITWGCATYILLYVVQGLAYLKEVRHISECMLKGTNPYEGEVTLIEPHSFDSWEEARLESLMGQVSFRRC